MRYIAVTTLAASLALAACTSVPDQSDVTRVDTLDIIRNIRCETKDAILRYPRSLDKSYITYAFEFTSIENNGLGGGSTFLIPITNGSFTLGLDAAVSRKREGEQVITFQEDLGNLRGLDCSRTRYEQSHRYPILGYVGTKEVVDRFVDLKSERGVTSDKFIRTLHFKLVVSGGIKPSISIVPAKAHKRDGNLFVTGSREDNHKVALSLKPPPSITKADGRRMSAEDASDELERAKRRALQELDVERGLRLERRLLDRLDE